MFLIMTLLLTIGCLAVSISCLRALPLFAQRFIVGKPLLSFAFNFALSALIAMFIGAGMASGAANLLASIIFAVYCLTYHQNVYLPRKTEN